MSGFTKQDVEILKYYMMNENRELYFNYLAQLEGNDGYGLLALGVVRNDNMPGAVANAFAARRAHQDGVEMRPRDWQAVGVDLIRNDLEQRALFLERGRPDLALNMPEWAIRDTHDPIFKDRGIGVDAWTPRQLLEAARRQGGNEEAQKIWSMMLDNRAWGALRAGSTMMEIATRYDDAQFSAAAYMGALAQVRAGVGVLSPASAEDPDNIRLGGVAYSFNRHTGGWQQPAPIETRLPAKVPVGDPALIQMLEEERGVRLEREQLRSQFHPDDPNQHRPLVATPWLISAELPQAPTPVAGLDPTCPGHPRHTLYQQCVDKVTAEDARLGRQWDHHSERMAAGLTLLAASGGLERVDHMVFSVATPTQEARASVFVVQGALDDPAHLLAHMPTDQATAQTPAAAFEQLQIVEQQQAQQLAEQLRLDALQEQHTRSGPVMGG